MHRLDTCRESLGDRPGLVDFSWILPGHGGRACRPPAEMHDRLVALVARMAIA